VVYALRFARQLAALEDTVMHRYDRMFPNDKLPMMYWGDALLTELYPLMEKAMRAGVPLTPEDLCAAQGIDMPPPDAKV
jgi:hypothetical protein